MVQRKLKSSDIRILLEKTLIKNVMTKPAITIEESDNFSSVEELFVKKEIRHLPVATLPS